MVVGGGPERQFELRCDHCGRAVNETLHTAAGYRVDYYPLHTGDVEPASLTTDGGAQISFLKLLVPLEIVTCANCYELASVQRERDERFRPERSAALVEVDSGE